jgi:hypothetical protein
MWTQLYRVIGLFSLVIVLGGCSGENDAGTPEDKESKAKSGGTTAKAIGKPKLTAPTGTASNEPWGDLKMRFVYDGSVPIPAKLTVDKNQDVCTKNHPVNESLLVNKTDKGIANVVVWLYLKRGEKPPQVHSSYDELADTPVYLDNVDCRFEPHVTILPTGRPLVIRNKDSIGHNTKCDFFNNASFNDQIEGGGKITKDPMTKPETSAMNVQCNAHGWMQAKIVIKDHPYVAKSDASGNLVIPKLPKGTWTFQFFHERPSYLGNLEFETGATDKRGRIEVEIQPGVNDLGEIVLADGLFED